MLSSKARIVGLMSLVAVMGCERKQEMSDARKSSLEIPLKSDPMGESVPHDVRIISLDGTTDNLCAISRRADASSDAPWKLITERSFSDALFLNALKGQYPNKYLINYPDQPRPSLEGFFEEIGYYLRFTAIAGAAIAAPVLGAGAMAAFAFEGLSIATTALGSASVIFAVPPVLEGGRMLARVTVDTTNKIKAQKALTALESAEKKKFGNKYDVSILAKTIEELPKYVLLGIPCSVEGQTENKE